MTPTERAALVAQYAAGADAFEAVVTGLTDADLDARPFPGEWTVREIGIELCFVFVLS